MQFHEKLDFLMNVSNIRNSQLAAYVKLDPSHISRLRRGKRGQIKNNVVMTKMAEYFAKRCHHSYQKKTLSDVLNINLIALDESELSKIILNWLKKDTTKDDAVAKVFLNNLSNLFDQTAALKQVTYTPKKNAESATGIYYGLNGKREAVERFLSEVVYHKAPQTLLLFSDEPTDWMMEDREFAFRWASLMSKILQQGNKIKIIHNVSRNFDEMLGAISQWMPLYMSGAIEPYYYPKKRDGLYKRTLFIAPKTAVLLSNSIDDTADSAANFYYKDARVIAAMLTEFTTYMNMCRQLMKIYTSIEATSFIEALFEFEKNGDNSIVISESLSLITMPESITSQVIKGLARSTIDLSALTENRIANFKRQIRHNRLTEIIRIQDPEKIIAGKVKINLSDLLDEKPTYYTLKTYILHLENILELLHSHKNFHVHLTNKELENPYIVYVKENAGAIVAKSSSPAVALTFSEGNLVAGFWDYLKSLIGNNAYQKTDKKESIRALKDYIDALKTLENSRAATPLRQVPQAR